MLVIILNLKLYIVKIWAKVRESKKSKKLSINLWPFSYTKNNFHKI